MAGAPNLEPGGITPPPMPPRGEVGKAVGPAAETGPQVGVSRGPSGPEAPTPGQVFVDNVVGKGGAQEVANTNPPEVTVPVANVETLMEDLANGQTGEAVQPVEGAPDFQPASAKVAKESPSEGNGGGPREPVEGASQDASQAGEPLPEQPAAEPNPASGNEAQRPGEANTQSGGAEDRADGSAQTAEPAQPVQPEPKPANQAVSQAAMDTGGVSQPDAHPNTAASAVNPAASEQAPQPARADNAPKTPEPPAPPKTPDAGPDAAGKTPDQRGGMAPLPDAQTDNSTHKQNEVTPNTQAADQIADLDMKLEPIKQEELSKDAVFQDLSQRIKALKDAGVKDDDPRVVDLQEQINAREQAAMKKVREEAINHPEIAKALENSDKETRKDFIEKAIALDKPEKNAIVRALRGIGRRYDQLINKAGVDESREQFYKLLRYYREHKKELNKKGPNGEVSKMKQDVLDMTGQALKEYAKKRAMRFLLRDYPLFSLALLALFFIAPAYVIQKLKPH